MGCHEHLVEYKSIEITKEIKEIKLFQDNKLIIVISDGLLFYDLITDNYLYNYEYNGILEDKENFHLELMDNDKLILTDSYHSDYNLIIIYKFIEEKKTNKFKLIELSKRYILKDPPYIKVNTALYIDKRIVVIGSYIFNVYKYYDYNGEIKLQTNISSEIINIDSDSINGFIFNNKIVGLFNIIKQEIYFYSLFDFKKVQQTIFPFNKGYRQITVYIYNCNNNDMILIGNTNKIFLYSFKENNILKTITYYYYNIRGICKGKNNSYYLLTGENFCKLDLKYYNDFYPLINTKIYNFSETFFLLTSIYREDSFIINHKNKITFFKNIKSEQKCTIYYFNLNRNIKIVFIAFLIYILFKI